MRLTIRSQIVVASLAVMLPLAAAEGYFILDHYRSERRAFIADARREAQAIASATAALLATLQTGAQVLAEEARLGGGDPRRVQPILERAVRVTGSRAHVAYILPGGRVGASVPQEIAASGLNLADRPFFQALRAGDGLQPINLTQGRACGIPVWGVAAAVREGTGFLGALAVTVSSVELEQLVPVKMPPGSWSIVDQRGRLVYLNGVPEIPWERRDRSGGELIRRALAGDEAASEQFAGPDGEPRLGASIPIRPFGWAVEVSQPVREALAVARTQGLIKASKFGPAFAMAILIAFIIGNRLGRPLSRLTVAADRVTRGEYDTAAEPGGPPEIARLMASFNTMAATLARRQKWDDALKAIGRTASSRMPLGEILAAGLQAMMEASGAPLGLIRLTDPATRDLIIAAHRGLPVEYLDVASRIPWGAKLAGHVASSGEPWLVGRLEERPDLSSLSILAERVQSLVCLPLQAHDQVAGTITLGQRQPGFFGPTDLPVLLQAASLLAGAILAEHLQTATQRESEEKTLLFRELDHRVRNNLAVLISLLHLAAEEKKGSAAETLQDMAERVARLADAHNMLTGRGMQPVEVRDLAEVVAGNVLAALPGAVRIQWRVAGVQTPVPPSQVTAIALVLNELLTNCAKHAFPGRATGSVSILSERDGDEAVLQVCDDGVGFDPAHHAAALGLTIVRTLVTKSLRGSVTVMIPGDGGTCVRIRFPRQTDTPTGGGP